jgi:DNA-binding CsgD family transcriptional regulator/pimeloyl-ACP methyl ester carboxylesterase
VYGQLLAELSRRWKVIRYDARGTGLSDREVSDFSGAALAMDIAAVARASGLEPLAIWGNTLTGPRAIMHAARYPTSVSHLVLYDTFFRPDSALPISSANALAALARSNWRLAAQAVAGLVFGAIDDPALSQFLARESVALANLYEQSTTGQTVSAMAEEMYKSWDATKHVQNVSCPVLVVHHLDNPMLALDHARTMAARFPNASLVTPEGAFASILTDALIRGVGPVLPTIDRFLDTSGPPPTREPSANLTARETEVLSLLASGRSGREIAAELSVSLSTVQRHIANIYAKIGARGRVEAAAYALERGLVRPRSE